MKMLIAAESGELVVKSEWVVQYLRKLRTSSGTVASLPSQVLSAELAGADRGLTFWVDNRRSSVTWTLSIRFEL